MFGGTKTVALFGRFTHLSRGDVARLLEGSGASITKDLTRATDLLAIGAGAINLVGSALPLRLNEARDRGVPVVSETRLLEQLRSADDTKVTLPLSDLALGDFSLTDLLNAFDVIRLSDNKIRFQDAEAIKSAYALANDGAEPGHIISALIQRQNAPKGRHRLALDADGKPLLLWDDGVTAVTGQSFLPLDEGARLDDLFEEALEAETLGDLNEAARLYQIITQHDRKDAIGPFNLGNVYLAQKDYKNARLAYQTAIARKRKFPEVHFNLAIVLEAEGKTDAAILSLKTALEFETEYPEALFNLAQLELATGRTKDAQTYFERLLTTACGHVLAPKAKRALSLIQSKR